MASLEFAADRIDVRCTSAEKVRGLARDFSFAKDAITSVDVVEDGMDGPRGVRSPGLGMPRLRYVGTWRRRKGKELVSVRRGQPALRITLRDQTYGAVVIGLDDAAAVRDRLQPE